MTIPRNLNSNQFTGFQHHVSPNQMALPGEEDKPGVHPLARHISEDTGFEHHYDPQYGIHSLTAVNTTEARSARSPGHGYIDWAGKEGVEKNGAHYPGEIQMIENTSTVRNRNPKKGLARDLYHAASTMSLGQDTLPIHSPTLTTEGMHFRETVGGEGAPEGKGAHKYKPPAGIHPYEQQPQPQGKMERREAGQRKIKMMKSFGHHTLPGM